MDVREIYDKYLSKLNHQERLELIELMSDESTESGRTATCSLLELEGLGAEVWAGIDAKEYVDDLRREWDRP